MTNVLDVAGVRKLFPIGAGKGGLAMQVSRWAGGTAARKPSLLHAVDDVSFSIGRGETVGLVGESGCGKSTLVRLVSRLLDPTAGTISFDGRDLADVPAARFGRSEYRARIQMVFQDANDSLNPRYTAFDAIADPLRRMRRLGGEPLRRRVGEVARQVGLAPELLPRYPHQLSGGQKARVGIARAIAVEPELLILDEPTSALDVSVQAVILQLLDDLRSRLDMSYLFVSHDLNVVRLLCDRVLVMYLGKIVESGPTDAVFDHPAHPYTRALLSAIPSFEPGTERRTIRITGEPRSPIDPDPNVCRFHGRCPKGTERCTQAAPATERTAGGSFVACHFPEVPVARATDALAAE